VLRGGPLEAAEDWVARRGEDLNGEERAFIAGSVGLRSKEKQRAEDELGERQARLAEVAEAQEKITLAQQEMAAAQTQTAGAQGRARRALAATAVVVALAALFVWWQYKHNLELQASLRTAQGSLADSMRAVNRQQVALDEAWETGRQQDEKLKSQAASLQTETVALQHMHSNLLGELAATQLGRNNPDASLRFAAKGTEDDAGLRLKEDVQSGSLVALTAAVSNSDWRLAFRAGEQRIAWAVFSPDGTRIVTASYDGTARVWDAATAKEIVVLHGHKQSVTYAAFSPDGILNTLTTFYLEFIRCLYHFQYF
jgi:hypothetical protein